MDNSASADDLANKEIVIISTHRSGTNFFCECLNEFPEILGLYEAFSPAGAFGTGRGNQLDILNELSGMQIKNERDPEIIELFTKRPNEALNLMSQVARKAGQQHLSYKIFQNQLELDTVKQIVSDPSREVIFLTRSRIDTYVSFVKARNIKAWKNKDTSQTKPRISIRAFMERAALIDAWFEDIADTLDAAGKAYRVLSYSSDVDMPKADLLRNIQATLASAGVHIEAPAAHAQAVHKRQDVGASPFDKVENGRTVRRKLKERTLLKYALTEPLAGRDITRGHATVDDA